MSGGSGGDRFTVTKANESAPIGDGKQDGYGAAVIDLNTDQKKGEFGDFFPRCIAIHIYLYFCLFYHGCSLVIMLHRCWEGVSTDCLPGLQTYLIQTYRLCSY